MAESRKSHGSNTGLVWKKQARHYFINDKSRQMAVVKMCHILDTFPIIRLRNIPMKDQWNVYKIAPIDHGWLYLRTVGETARLLGGHWAEAAVNGLVADHPTVETFLASYHYAHDAALAHGYDGINRQEPVVFWFPDAAVFNYGFVFKSDIGGITYVVSPKPLKWLDSLSGK